MFSTEKRIFWLRIIVASGFIAGFLLSHKLWVGPRAYTLAPVLDFLPVLGVAIEYFLFFGAFTLLVGVIFSPKPRHFIYILIGIVFFLGLFDQSRLQPWVYQYFFMLAALSFLPWKSGDTERSEKVLNVCRLLVGSIYFWSGLQKINPGFIGIVFPWMVDPLAQLLPEAGRLLLYVSGLFAPFLEAGIGIALLTKKWRNAGVVLAVLMHLFILLMIGPAGHNWNSVVWPWNIAMMLFVLLLFWNAKEFSFRDVLWEKRFLFQKIVLLFFGVLPFFSFLNLWDSYLSSALYSGNVNIARLYVDAEVVQRLPPEIQRYTKQTEGGKTEVDIYGWSFGELNVPPYPETRIYKKVARSICAYAAVPSQVMIVIEGKPTVFNSDHRTTYDCSKL